LATKNCLARGIERNEEPDRRPCEMNGTTCYFVAQYNKHNKIQTFSICL